MPEKTQQEHRPFEQVIRIAYRPSRMVFIILMAVHILAFASILVAEILPGAKFFLALLVASGLYKSCRDYSRPGNSTAKTELVLDASDVWHLVNDKQDTTELTLLPAVFVHPVLVILRFTDVKRKKYSFILTPDNLDKDSLRRLRVRLRFRNTVPDDRY